MNKLLLGAAPKAIRHMHMCWPRPEHATHAVLTSSESLRKQPRNPARHCSWRCYHPCVDILGRHLNSKGQGHCFKPGTLIMLRSTRKPAVTRASPKACSPWKGSQPM